MKTEQVQKSIKYLELQICHDEHVADYSRDYTKIQELALQEKRMKAVQKWMEEKIRDTYVSLNAESKDCNFVNNWLKK